jgi:hypothetical protein
MRKTLLAVLVVVAALGGFAWLALPPSEPVYQGKPLSFWLQGYDSGRYNFTQIFRPSPTFTEADEALGQIGAKAIPILLQMLQERDSGWNVMIARLLRRQLLVNIKFSTSPRNMTALSAFSVLGPEASNAVPRLIKIFKTDPSPFLQQAVPVILGYIGPAAEPAIPALLRGVTHTNEIVRNDAIFALWRIHAKPALVVPALIKCLNDPDIFVRAQAARALGAFGKDGQPAVPALLELARREPSRRNDRWLVKILDNTIVSSSWAGRPTPSSGDGPDVGDLANQALKQIDPQAAAKAGVK